VERTETGRLELKVSGDPRLLAGVSAAIDHFAEASGLRQARRAEFIAAFEDALQEAFPCPESTSKPLCLTLALPAGQLDAILVLPNTAADAGRAEAIQKKLSGKVGSVALENTPDAIRIHLTETRSARRKER